MYYIKDNVHSFDINGLKIGDLFLGCPICWFRLEPRITEKPMCPNCKTRMTLYNVEASDLEKTKDLK